MNTKSAMHRVFLVDDHPIILEGVRALVGSQPNLMVVGAANDADAAVDGIHESLPDLVIIDGSLRFADGSSLLDELIQRFPHLLVVGLTFHEEGTYAREFLKAGAHGFVLKRSASDDLLKAIQVVTAGGIYIDPAVASKVLATVSEDRCILRTSQPTRIGRGPARGERLQQQGSCPRTQFERENDRDLSRKGLRETGYPYARRPGPVCDRPGMAGLGRRPKRLRGRRRT